MKTIANYFLWLIVISCFLSNSVFAQELIFESPENLGLSPERIDKIENELLKKFPDDFIYGFKTELLDLPGKPLTIGSELFGQYEVVDIEGNSFIQTDDYNFVK